MERLLQQYFSSNIPLSAVFLLIFHIVGVAGLVSPISDLFLGLTPGHLLLVFVLLIRNHADWNGVFIRFLLGCVSLSFLVELVGVQTGSIFGAYEYGTVLGVRIGGTPLLIGVLWFTLIYSIGVMLAKLRLNTWGKALVGSVLMVGIDLLIEPVAIHLGFWDWTTGRIPIQNFVAWFVISFVLFLWFYRASFQKSNRLAFWIFLLLFGFFLSLNFILLNNG